MNPVDWVLVGAIIVFAWAGWRQGFIAGALSGYGTMAACATGALCAAWVTGNPVPDYAKALTFEIFNDWKQWAELSGEYIGTQRRFSDALLARRFDKWRNSMGVRGYQGIDLKQPTSLPARSYPYNDD